MKKSSPLYQKLASYSVLSGSFFASSCINANAQIVYTDVTPDDTLLLGGLSWSDYYFDLNNDSNFDYDLNLNPVGQSSIVAALYKANPYSTGGMATVGGSYLVNFLQGDSICVEPHPWIYGLGCCAFFFFVDSNGAVNGEWNLSDINHYVGLRLYESDGFHYGWLRLDIAPDASFIIIKDYAYNLLADSCIIAGQGIVTSSPGVEQHFENTIYIYPNPVMNHATLKYQLDHEALTRVQLTDVTGKVLKTFISENRGAGKHKEDLNLGGIAAGIYILQLKVDDKLVSVKILKQ